MSNEENTNNPSDTCKENERVIKLNIGGASFSTAFSTLKPSKYFEQLLNSNDVEALENGEVYIDRDGELFGIILEYLRSYKIHDTGDLYELKCEAQFYQLDSLVCLLDEMLQKKCDSKKKEYKLVTLDQLAYEVCLSEFNSKNVTETLSSRYEFVYVVTFYCKKWNCRTHGSYPTCYMSKKCFSSNFYWERGDKRQLLLVSKIPHVLKLNIGGKSFHTKREMLKDFPYFQNLVGQPYESTGFSENGRNEIFIDRSGDMFRHILQYIRTKTVFTNDKDTLNKLKVEAEYYGLENLIEDINEKEKQIEDNKDEFLFLDEEEIIKLYMESLETSSGINQNGARKSSQVIASINMVENRDVCIQCEKTYITFVECEHSNKKCMEVASKRTIVRRYDSTYTADPN
ncbi:hypothetical protein INT47_000044 [Mucor saturninus]|uniref:BTB domain-containing protein n=1 Tax=Mucor saturninus TaxID=64648 RepID=A0A8H7V899_9FUNG|nr:hypothetical protein INT47_000044 [Mucor saturninus]